MNGTMKESSIGAVCFHVDAKHTALLYAFGTMDTIGATEEPCMLGSRFSVRRYKDDAAHKDLLRIDKGVDDMPVLRLLETQQYTVKLLGPDGREAAEGPQPKFQNETNRSLHVARDGYSAAFQFVNYLGRSRITFGDTAEDDAIRFEVVPQKFDYEDDYIRLTEAIAGSCARLLLDVSGATSNVFRQAVRPSDTLLEQFIFLRQFCYSENLPGLFAAIRRNPDRALVAEETFQPYGTGMPSQRFFRIPFSCGRGWVRIANGSCLPQVTTVERKHDTLDTPANRFLRFAFERFDEVCVHLSERLTDTALECVREAQSIHAMLDDILHDTFFDDVGTMDILPQNNQALVKREGYAQVFASNGMLDLALQLDWHGKDKVYEGESKNVALLYEYWLFFELYKIIHALPGCEAVQAGIHPFFTADASGLTISLSQSKESCQSFRLPAFSAKLNLYYNRTFAARMFTHDTFSAACYAGSYSRPFRPDYTIAVFPDVYADEDAAVMDGAVSFLHFDAKYRVDDLASLVGRDHENDAETEDELSEEKAEAVTNTYKRGDLLKMHTYNDAIRRTAGSYVLYPGDGTLEGEAFHIYDEILPGVGAFAMKPSRAMEGEEALRTFFVKFIAFRVQRQSRMNRMMYAKETVLREPPARLRETMSAAPSASSYHPPQPRAELCILGYLRPAYLDTLRKAGCLRVGRTFLFYWHAIRGDVVYPYPHGIFQAGFFRCYANQAAIQRRYELEPLCCEVLAGENALLSRAELTEALAAQGCLTKEADHHADFYYALTVRVTETSIKRTVLKSKTVDSNAKTDNGVFHPYAPKIIRLAQAMR